MKSIQEPTSAWFAPDLSQVERAALMAVAYADIFDYPRTAEEVQRYLVGEPASLDQVREVLKNGRLSQGLVSAVNGYYMLSGREALEGIRHERQCKAQRLWPYALRYGKLLAGLPFVRMVAITGALAVNNVGGAADIDYLIVTEPGRLWVCRAWVIAVVRAAKINGQTICPNYFLSESALVFDERNLYTAHELAQMVPLAGRPLYNRIRRLNPWAVDFLPNAFGPPPGSSSTFRAGHPISKVGEALLQTRLGARLESWEMSRKLEKFSASYEDNPETMFSAEWCKGHVDQHGRRTMQAFESRLRRLQEDER